MSTRHSAALLVVAILWAAGCGPSPVDAPGGDWTGGAPGPPPLFATPDGGVTLRFVDTPAEVPDLTMETLDGRTISMAAQRGKVVLVNFWATWCGPCREEIPFLVRLAERYPDHLTVIGVSEDHGSPDAVAAFGAQYDVNYPLVMSTPEIKRAFPGVFALPTSFVVDPEGRMVESHVGLISPVILEQETRYLASLTHDATIETAPSNDQIRLANAAQATEIPGVDLSVLTPEQREEVLLRVNEEGCPCGCSLTLAQCRINDSACGVSPPLVDQLVAEVAGAE
ncbi:MAG: TlpA family protein disulfide reductase [Acidobacteria bacterium]|nr:TlpA family protein disulfide reductase [Acidobacteriota bacterium]